MDQRVHNFIAFFCCGDFVYLIKMHDRVATTRFDQGGGEPAFAAALIHEQIAKKVRNIRRSSQGNGHKGPTECTRESSFHKMSLTGSGRAFETDAVRRDGISASALTDQFENLLFSSRMSGGGLIHDALGAHQCVARVKSGRSRYFSQRQREKTTDPRYIFFGGRTCKLFKNLVTHGRR